MGEITYFLGGVLQPFLLYMLWSFMLKPRWKKHPFWCYAICATLVVQIPTIIRSMAKGALYDLMAYGQLIVLIVFVAILFKDKVWAKVCAVVVYYCSALMAEVITFSILGEESASNAFGDGIEALIVNMLAMIILFCILGTIVLVWNILLKKNYVPKHIVLFLLFPLGQICMIDIWPQLIKQGNMELENQFTMFLGLFIGAIADAILFYIMFKQGEKEEMQRKLAEIEQVMELEREHYNMLKESQEELAKVRHDFNNQLTVALQMMEDGNKETSREMLEEMRQELKKSGEKIWCENAVINAVLLEKSRACEESGIRFTAEVDITEYVKINSLHLCSVFSNLLDNAITAAKEFETEVPMISLKTSLKEKYLYIKVENASHKPVAKVHEKGHGYGLQIINNIVEKYNGEFQTSWEDNIFKALVVLELPDKK